jgi:Notch-like protein
MNYNRKILKSSDKNKTTWDIIKLETAQQFSNGDIQLLGFGWKPYYQQAIADTCNNYFSSIVDTNHKKNIYNKARTNDVTISTPLHFLLQKLKNPFPAMVFKSFSTKEIITIIKSLKSKNSHGYDEVPNKLLKISAPYICSPLTYICNKSISSGIFPDSLKYSIMKPLYKKGDKMNIANYRPLSLLASFSKVFEKAMYNRLTEHLKRNKILLKG